MGFDAERAVELAREPVPLAAKAPWVKAGTHALFRSFVVASESCPSLTD